MADRSKDFGKKEAQARFEAALRGGLKTPPTPLAERIGKKDMTPKEIEALSDEIAEAVGNKKRD